LKLTVISNVSETCIGASMIFKKGYQPRNNIVKDENGYWFTDSQSILAGWRKHFSQLFNVHGVSDVRQTGIHTV